MDQLICASLSHTHYYWYEVGMLKVPAEIQYTGWNDLREPHGNRDGSDLHRRTVGGWIGLTVRSVVDGVIGLREEIGEEIR